MSDSINSLEMNSKKNGIAKNIQEIFISYKNSINRDTKE